MSWFGRKKRNEPQPAPAAPAPKAQPDFLSPLWTNWPPREPAAQPVPTVEPQVHQAMPEPLVTPPPAPPPPPAPIKPIIIVTPPPPSPPPILPAPAAAPPPTPPPPPIQARSNPPPVPDGPAVVVQRVRQITEPPPPVQPREPIVQHDFDHPTPRRVPVVPPEARVPTPPARPIPTPPPLPARNTQRPAAASPHELMRGSMQRGDWLSARALADKILAYDPTDLDAHACIEACTHHMRDSIEVRLGDRSRILRVAVPDQWLAEMALDPRAAYLLSRIDGVSTIDAILDVSGMAESEGAKLLVDLLEEGVLEAHKPLPRVSSRPPR